MDETKKDFAAIIVAFAAVAAILLQIWTANSDWATKLGLSNLLFLVVLFIYIHFFFERKKKENQSK